MLAVEGIGNKTRFPVNRQSGFIRAAWPPKEFVFEDRSFPSRSNLDLTDEVPPRAVVPETVPETTTLVDLGLFLGCYSQEIAERKNVGQRTSRPSAIQFRHPLQPHAVMLRVKTRE